MKGTVEVHGMTFQWEFFAASGRAGYELRVSFADLRCERDYPTGMSPSRVQKEAVRLAEEVCYGKRK
jgi:hypothetical protein